MMTALNIPYPLHLNLSLYNPYFCSNYFNKDERTFAQFWIGLWSVLCCISTAMTVLTFFIDMDRFRYSGLWIFTAPDAYIYRIITFIRPDHHVTIMDKQYDYWCILLLLLYSVCILDTDLDHNILLIILTNMQLMTQQLLFVVSH